jgi:hypothetical protein
MCYAEQSSVGLPIFKVLGEDRTWVNRSIKFQDYHFERIKGVIARNIYYRGKPGDVYVGCPNTFCIDPGMIRKHFPHAKLIINIRDPKEALPSFVAMISALRGQPLSELDDRLKRYFKTVSRAMYEGSAKYPGDANTFYHSFNYWKDDGPKSLERILKWLGWEFEPADL